MTANEAPKNPKQFPRYVEIGSSGLARSGGYISSDFLAALQGQNGAKVFKEMGLNDPIISAMLFAVSMLVRSVEWSVEPADDSSKAAAARDLVEEELFNKMATPFAEVIAEVCSMFMYGYCPVEIVYARREDNVIGVRKLVARAQETIERWVWDEGYNELLGCWQLDYYTGKRAFLPKDKLLLFRTDPFLQNPEGRSILRGAYVSWRRKKTIEEAEGRAALRAAGLVVMRIPSELLISGLSAEEQAAANGYIAAAKAIAQDRQGSIILPSDVHAETKAPLYNVEYVVADGRRPADMTPIVERIDKRIASTILADFILLGQQSAGSFALSSDKTALFAQAVGAWLKVIASVFNRQLLTRLWAINQFDEEAIPRLTAGDIENRSLAELGQFVSTLSSSGMPLFPDETLQAYLRQVAGFPKADEAAVLAAQSQPKPPDNGSGEFPPGDEQVQE